MDGSCHLQVLGTPCEPHADRCAGCWVLLLQALQRALGLGLARFVSYNNMLLLRVVVARGVAPCLLRLQRCHASFDFVHSGTRVNYCLHASRRHFDHALSTST